MFFRVDLHSPKPVYQQLIDQVKLAFASGRLKPDDRLPPIRDVAVALRINRNTVARVYTELEREGVLYTRAGQGCFVSDRGSNHLNAAAMREDVTARFDEVLAQARVFGMGRAAVADLFAERLDLFYDKDKKGGRKLSR